MLMKQMGYNNRMNNDENKILITTEDNKQVEGTILLHFEANGDDFVLYELKDRVHAAKIDGNNNLSPVEEDEWPLVEKIYNEFMEEVDKENGNI